MVQKLLGIACVILGAATACGADRIDESFNAFPEPANSTEFATSTAAPTGNPSPSPTPGAAVSPPPQPSPLVITQLACRPQQALCGLRFSLGATTYMPLCVRTLDAFVEDNVLLGSGELRSVPAVAAAIESVDPSLGVAVKAPGGDCLGDLPDGSTRWSLALNPWATPAEKDTALCSVGDLSHRQRAANLCHLIDGSLLSSCGDGPPFPASALDNIDQYKRASKALGPATQELLEAVSSAPLKDWRFVVSDPATPTRDFYTHLLLRPLPTNDRFEYALLSDNEVILAPSPCVVQAAS